MPSLTTTIEDNSPLISYSADWRTGSSADNAASRYSQSSFMATQTSGGVASFSFSGTGVHIFGAKRGNHGLYQVKIDDTLYPSANGNAPDPGEFQAPLFTVTGLTQGSHNLTLTNLESKFVDIDYITWETEIGQSSDKLFVNTFQDSDPSFAYSPSESAWSTTPKNQGSFFGGSGHATSNAGSSLVYNFKGALLHSYIKIVKLNKYLVGDAVSLYGPVGPEGSPYGVQVDNGPPKFLTSLKERYTPQMLLYHASDLGPGDHTLKLTYQPSSSDQTIAVDYANIYTTVPPQSQPQNSSSSTLSAGPAVGITLSIVGIIGVLVALILFLRRRRIRKQLPDETFEPKPYLFEQPPSRRISTTATDSNLGHDSVSPVSLASLPVWTVPPPTMATNNSSSKHQVRFLEYREEPQWPEASSTPSSSRSNSLIRATTNSLSPRRTLSQSAAPPSKGQSVELPGTAGRSLQGIPEDELRANRRVVEGREQDFGSTSTSAAAAAAAIASSSSSSPDPFSSILGHYEGLPPDYSQATEPYVSNHAGS